MSVFKNKADDVYKQGVLERGEFEPTGAPKKMYQYWASHSDNVPATENFCHFWRVVAIWAPLMYFRRGIARVAEKPVTWIVAAALYVLVAIILGAFISWLIPLAAFGIPWLLLNTLNLCILADEGDFKECWNETDYRWAMVIGFIGTAIYLAARGVYYGFKKIPVSVLEKFGIGAAVIVGIAGFGYYISLFFTAGIETLWVTLSVFGILLAAAGVALVVSGLAGVLSSRASRKRAEQREANRKAEEAWLKGEGPYPYSDEKTELPVFVQKIVAFISGIADFIILIFNVVRVNKWKICPIVRIDS